MLENTAVAKLIIATLIGGMIGYTRKNKPAGTRTFALICLGCTILTVISLGPFNNSDPTRIIASIVSGIGFLGLGVIWHNIKNSRPAGLTTAAGVWVTSAIGILIGLDYWIEVVVGSILAMAVLYSREPLAYNSKKVTKNGNLSKNKNSELEKEPLKSNVE